MQIEVSHRPAYALAKVSLDAGEAVVAEGGAMVSMDTHVTVETKAASKEGQGLMGGLMSGLKRMVAGESFFQNTFTASGSPGAITFAPKHVGDIVHYTMNGSTGLVLQSTAYLCSAATVEIDAKWGGSKSFFGGEGLFMLKASGQGPIVFNSFGAIKEIDVTGDFIVDNGHIVAFEDTLSFTNTKFGGGLLQSFLGGEGLVCKFTGTGKLWIQTRNPQGFGEALAGKLPMRTS
jgi:uncharacterized protein (TIGR00266 family)